MRKTIRRTTARTAKEAKIGIQETCTGTSGHTSNPVRFRKKGWFQSLNSFLVLYKCRVKDVRLINTMSGMNLSSGLLGKHSGIGILGSRQFSIFKLKPNIGEEVSKYLDKK